MVKNAIVVPMNIVHALLIEDVLDVNTVMVYLILLMAACLV